MIVTLTLNPSIDYIMQVPKISMEDTLRATEAYFQAGGKGINVSRVLTRLGVKNEAWGFCGGDTGQWLKNFLDKEHVKHDFISIKSNTRINTIITEISTHKQLRVSTPGGDIYLSDEATLFDKFNALPSNTEWLSVGGNHPPGLNVSCTKKLIEMAKLQGIRSVLDADGEILKDGLKGKPYLIKPNQYELSRLLGKTLQSMDEIIEGGRSLIEQGLVDIIVISLAEYGAVLISKKTVLIGKAPKVEVVSKVGAGDSMVAGLIKGLIEHAPLEDMLKMGISAGTAAVMTGGTDLCYVEDYIKLLGQVDIETIAVC